jgi:hypothetical protein
VGVHCDLILGGIANQALILREGDIRRSCAVTLIVRDDLNAIILPDTDATVCRMRVRRQGCGIESSRIGCAEIDTNSFGDRHRCSRIGRVDGARVDATLSFYKR